MIEDSDLLRLVDGECSPEEARAIQAWIAADPARGELLDQVRAVWRLTGDTSRPRDLRGARGRPPRGRGRHAGPEYGVRTRAVELEGEAYFVVRHDPAHPFLVRTAHGTTEDLGTEFDVRAYREERSLQVVVALGRVALRRAGGADSLLLHPRDRGVIAATGTVTINSCVSLQHYLAWVSVTQRCDDAPLAGILAQLERWYDLEIQTTDRSLERERLTIAFTTASPDEALSALARVLGARFTRDDRVVRLISVHRGP